MAITLVVEDGTGLATANVYDLSSAAETWLSDRGYTQFAAGTSTEKDRALLQATEMHEHYWQGTVSGYGVPTGGDDQALLWPRSGAVDGHYRPITSTTRPARYREGIFLTAEDMRAQEAAGRRVDTPHLSSYVREHSDEAGRVEYRTPASIYRRFPRGFDHARGAWPAGLRSVRA